MRVRSVAEGEPPSSASVLCSITDGVATVVLNRPDKRNALTRELLQSLLTAFDTIEAKPDVRVTVVQGNGDAFCAGMDLAGILAMRDERGWFDYELLPEALHRLASLPHPTIAFVNGPAIAGGCELALHCDIRIGTPNAKFGMPLARLGMVAPAYAIKRLMASIGMAAARDLLLSADIVNAEHALRLGLLTRLTKAEEAGGAVSRLATQISGLAPLALREMKRAIAQLSSNPSPAAEAELDRIRLDVSRSADLREGLSAFLGRRQPIFRGE